MRSFPTTGDTLRVTSVGGENALFFVFFRASLVGKFWASVAITTRARIVALLRTVYHY